MFWILRRTGAANFFNSINNNYSSKSGNSNNNNSDKQHSRPPRKEYGRLSVEDDSGSLHSYHQYPHHLQPNQHPNEKTSPRLGLTANGSSDNANGPGHRNLNDDNFNLIETTPHAAKLPQSPTSITMMSTTNSTEFGPNDDDDDHNEAYDVGVESSRRRYGDGAYDSDAELDRTLRANRVNNRCYSEQTALSRLQAMALSDDDDYDESLTCNVCDRAFHCHRQLASHQQKKRHFGCSGCDSLFPSLMLLEHHKEEFEHWSDVDDESGQPTCCRRSRSGLGVDDFTDTDSITSDAESEDLERLL